MRRTVPLSPEIEKKIDEPLASGVATSDHEGPLTELAQMAPGAALSNCTQQPYSGFSCRAGPAPGYSSEVTKYDCDTPGGSVILIAGT